MSGRLIFFTILFSCLGVACVWQRLHSRQLQYEIGKQQTRVHELKENNARLTSEVEKLKNPDRLMAVVDKHDLQMNPTRPGRILTVTDLRRESEQHRGFASLRRIGND